MTVKKIHTHTVLTDSCLSRYSGSTRSKFIEYLALLHVLYVIIITNIEFVCEFVCEFFSDGSELENQDFK